MRLFSPSCHILKSSSPIYLSNRLSLRTPPPSLPCHRHASLPVPQIQQLLQSQSLYSNCSLCSFPDLSMGASSSSFETPSISLSQLPPTFPPPPTTCHTTIYFLHSAYLSDVFRLWHFLVSMLVLCLPTSDVNLVNNGIMTIYHYFSRIYHRV